MVSTTTNVNHSPHSFYFFKFINEVKHINWSLPCKQGDKNIINNQVKLTKEGNFHAYVPFLIEIIACERNNKQKTKI
jgi:hypothetical protein